MHTHGRRHRSAEEYALRRANYYDNKRFIEARTLSLLLPRYTCVS